jgi:hypothetical protein
MKRDGLRPISLSRRSCGSGRNKSIGRADFDSLPQRFFGPEAVDFSGPNSYIQG